MSIGDRLERAAWKLEDHIMMRGLGIGTVVGALLPIAYWGNEVYASQVFGGGCLGCVAGFFGSIAYTAARDYAREDKP
ncbi:MAG: hypothetical protein WCV90_01720 [Candidatus Woesearchaeota archaeon]|jgi:hypothetical protein